MYPAHRLLRMPTSMPTSTSMTRASGNATPCPLCMHMSMSLYIIFMHHRGHHTYLHEHGRLLHTLHTWDTGDTTRMKSWTGELAHPVQSKWIDRGWGWEERCVYEGHARHYWWLGVLLWWLPIMMRWWWQRWRRCPVHETAIAITPPGSPFPSGTLPRVRTQSRGWCQYHLFRG